MKAVAYCRVSTIEQGQEGFSLANQKDRIAAWCLGNGYDLESVYVETGSGGRADNRPELSKAISQACKLKGILVVYSLSRFSRSVRDTLELSDRLEQAGANLASLTEKLDTSSAVGRMVFRLLSTLSAFEREQLAERTSSAMGYMRKTNRRISKVVPYGYALGEGGNTLKEEPSEQAVIAEMEGMKAQGQSLLGIARHLNERRIPTREGKTWFASTVRYILLRKSKLAA